MCVRVCTILHLFGEDIETLQKQQEQQQQQQQDSKRCTAEDRERICEALSPVLEEGVKK